LRDIRGDRILTIVDQQKIRRGRTGLIAHDPALAQPGYTLFTPMYGDGTVYLIDMAGEVAHSWHLPYRPGLYGHLLPNGHLFYGGKVMHDLDRFEAWPRFKAGAALEVDWQGRTIWEVRHPDHHHDARLLRNGNVLLLCLRALAPEIARRVQGGLPGTEANGVIYADYLLEVTTSGEVVWEWRSWEHMEPERYPITPQDMRHEWTHGNTVAETAEGHILVSFRNISTVVMIERASGNIIWQIGGPPLAQQHDPRPLPNGNILIFDTSAVPSPISGDTPPTVSAPEYTNPVYTLPGGGAGATTLDSAAEDCMTGIALAADEFKSSVYLADLTQAKQPPASPGTWTAPQQFVSLPEFQVGEGFGDGISGMAVAPGTQLAIVTSEYGGRQVAVLQLPSSSGSGTPGPVDYAVANLPTMPNGQTWSQGLDPHMATAYVGPNNGKAYGLLGNAPISDTFLPPSYLAVVDMQALLAAPRSSAHTVDPNYDLRGNGVVRYVATGN
jgi:hypothetical protein